MKTGNRARTWAAAWAVVLAMGCTSDEERRMVVAANVYDRHCASCHGLSETGPTPVEGLGFEPADLRRLGEHYGTPLPRGQLAGYIDGRHGLATGEARLMPVWGEQLYEQLPDTAGVEAMRAGTIELLLDYLESIQKRS